MHACIAELIKSREHFNKQCMLIIYLCTELQNTLINAHIKQNTLIEQSFLVQIIRVAGY